MHSRRARQDSVTVLIRLRSHLRGRKPRAITLFPQGRFHAAPLFEHQRHAGDPEPLLVNTKET